MRQPICMCATSRPESSAYATPTLASPRLSTERAQARHQVSPRMPTPLREAPATAFRSPSLTANRSASVNRGVTRDRPVPFT